MKVTQLPPFVSSPSLTTSTPAASCAPTTSRTAERSAASPALPCHVSTGPGSAPTCVVRIFFVLRRMPARVAALAQARIRLANFGVGDHVVVRRFQGIAQLDDLLDGQAPLRRAQERVRDQAAHPGAELVRAVQAIAFVRVRDSAVQRE